MNETQWAHRLADINAAIYDTEKDLSYARTQIDLVQYNLDNAERQGENSSITSMESKLKYWRSCVQRYEKELEQYKKKLKDHYAIEPKG